MPYYGWTSPTEKSAISMSGESRVTVTNNTVYSLRGITGFIPTNSINSTEKIALRDITIKNNQITGAALAGIDLWGLHADLSSANILTENNTIEIKGGATTDRYTGVQSTLKQATGAITFHQYMDNIDLIDNTIDAKGREFPPAICRASCSMGRAMTQSFGCTTSTSTTSRSKTPEALECTCEMQK